ncbi:MAG TPA: PAS domain S-box protein, partial [Trichocoleus sp.]
MANKLSPRSESSHSRLMASGLLKLGRRARKTGLLTYGVALLSVGLALGACAVLDIWIHPAPTSLFFIAVMVSAWYGGLGPGLVATILSTVAISYCFVSPYYALKALELGSVLRLGVFVAASLLISWLKESRRSAMRREQRLRAISETAQREAETAKERLEAVLSSIGDSFYVVDREWRFTYVNQRLCQLLSKSSQEILGQPIWDLLPNGAGLDVQQQLEQAWSRQGPVQFECFYPDWGRWYEHRVYPSPEGLAVLGADISDRKRIEAEGKQAETALGQSEARFRRIFECNMVPMGTWSSSGIIVHANDALLELIGYTRQELEAGEISWQALTPAEWAAHDEAALAEIARGNVISPFEKEYIHKQGHRIPILAGGASFLDDPNTGVFFAIDLSDRKRTEAALQQSEERLRVAL